MMNHIDMRSSPCPAQSHRDVHEKFRRHTLRRFGVSGYLYTPIINQVSTSMSSFRPCTPAEVRRIIMSSPVKSCSLDVVPTFLVREYLDVLLPYVTGMVNASLAQGRLPVSATRHRDATSKKDRTQISDSLL